MDSVINARKGAKRGILSKLFLALFLPFCVFGYAKTAKSLPIFHYATSASSFLTEGCYTEVEPDEEWEEKHPSCTVTATVNSCDAAPVPSVGTNCYQSTGAEKIAIVHVFDGENQLVSSWQIQAVDGVVQVVLLEDL